MRLTVVAARNAKPKAKAYKLFDGNGLFLLVHPNGSKYWRLKYIFADKEKSLSLGVFDETSLQEARAKAQDAKKQLSQLIDPSFTRKVAKVRAKAAAENSFKSVAEDWLKKRKAQWTDGHVKKVTRRLETDVFPKLGALPINQITPLDVLGVLRKLEEREVVYSAHRIHQMLGQIFRYAVVCGKAERDITVDLRGALTPVVKEHHKYLSHNELPEFLEKLANYEGDLQTKHATQLLLTTFVRTKELRGAKWSEVNIERAEWRIPAERMKMRTEHIVPLSKQAVALFEAQRSISGSYEYIFPNRNSPTTFISENTIIYAIYRMGYHSRATAHGFRATASTILNENGFPPDVIERQLAHCERNQVRASYNYAQYLPERRRMMQWWGDYLTTTAPSGDRE